MDHMGNDLAPILVTGATGYLGGAVRANLMNKKMSYVATSRTRDLGEVCDLTDVDAVDVLLEKVKPSAIIHCAAVVPKSASAYDDARSAEVSVAMLKTLALAADCPIVFASSMTLYAVNTRFPVHEDDAQSPRSGYAHGKWLAEQILFERDFKGDVALRLPGLFGLPRQSGLLYNAANAFLRGDKFEPNITSDIWAAMDVHDAAEYLVRATTNPQLDYPSQAVNVGYEGEFTVLAAVSELATCCGLKWQAPQIIEQPFSMCLERLKTRYGMLTVTFRQRLEELVEVVRQDMQSKLPRGLNAH